MSSSLSSATTATQTSTSPSSSSSEASSSGSTSPPTTLYLFTFLATLFLLLFVSAAIVLRSFILRRRFRRRVEEAIAAGLLLAPTPGAPGSFRTLEKPKLYDASLAPAVNEQWGNIMPVAANLATTREGRGKGSSAPVEQEGASSALFSLAILRHPFARRRAPPLLQPSSVPTSPRTPSASQSTGSEVTPDDPLSQTSDVQISVIIMMPNPHRSNMMDIAGQSISVKGKERSSVGYWDEEEEGVPDVVLGVAQVTCARSSDSTQS